MFKKFSILLAILMVLGLVVAGCGGNDAGEADQSDNQSSGEPAEDTAWVPEKPIEFVVPYSAGGGSDTNARALAKVLTQNDLVPVDIMVVNKPGGSGAVGDAYIASKKGSEYTIATWVNGQQTAAVANNADVGLNEVTPLSILAIDSYAYMVSADSPYDTMEEFVAAAKENPGTLTVGGSAKGSEDHMSKALVDRGFDIDTKYVAFDGGGEVIAAILGGHVNAGLANPNEMLGQLEAGKVKVLGVLSEERMGGPLAEVPTMKELGADDTIFHQFRGYAVPPETPQEVIDWWADTLKKASETEDWKNNYIAPNSLTPMYLTPDETYDFMHESLDSQVSLLRDLGFID